ncbi:MAG: hypothetical protein IID28_13830 [Planctomycetes bacterium]|nr:hypothetical protein [Planctomycetota bacterium]
MLRRPGNVGIRRPRRNGCRTPQSLLPSAATIRCAVVLSGSITST